MISPWLGIGAALAAFGIWFVIGNALSKVAAVSDELARKFVHVTMGLTCLTFPWVFSESWPVLLLGGMSAIGLLAVKCSPRARANIGRCLHSVERQSLGELCFAAGVTLLFWWSDGRPLTYCVPVLILTIADAAGALIGLRYGKTSFATLSGHKSAEGSAMFFLAAFLSAHVPLLLFSDIARAEVLIISLTLATMVMLVEAITTGGLDNLLIPLGGYLLLTEYMKMEIGMLVGRLGVVAFLLILVLVLRKRSSLDGGALLGAALFGYGCFALGGWPCFITPLIVFFSHLRATRKISRRIDETHTLSAILSISATGMVWLVLRRDDPVPAFTLGLVAHFAILNFNTLKFLDPNAADLQMIVRSSARSVLLCYTPLLIFQPDLFTLLVAAASAIPITMTSTWLFSRIFPARPKVSGSAGRWITECAIATIAACAALLI